jgi:hypothetical protein
VVLIAWGVALEERHSLREIFGLDVGVDEAREARIDQLCHRYGLGQLLLGLFSEMGVEFVRVPDRVINTAGIEGEVIVFSAVLLTICIVMLLTQIGQMFLLRPVAAAGGHGHD